MSDRTKRQVLEMSFGIVVHNLVLAVVCLIWFRNIPSFIGIFVGFCVAEALLISIARSTELCVESADENFSTKKMALHAMLRSFSVIAVIGILWKFTNVNILTAALGALGMKTGAYLYPHVHKRMDNKAG